MFFKKHYEKIILVVFLLIFAILLVWLIGVFLDASKTSKADVLVQTPDSPNYKPIDTSSMNAFAEIVALPLWKKAPKRDESSVDSSDFMAMYQAARCVNCNKIVPFYYYERKEKCPFCHAKLEASVVKMETDIDGDGLEDAYERQIGMDPKDKDDILYDIDLDGFTNIAEINAKTLPNDKKSHPPLATRLAFVKSERVKLDFKATKVTARGDDKAKWDLQAELLKPGKSKPSTEFFKIGDIIDIKGQKYKLTDIELKSEDVIDKRLKATVTKDVSQFVLSPMSGAPPIKATVGKPVYSSMAKVILTDLYDSKKYNGYVNDVITVGDDGVGFEKYRILSLDESKGGAKIKLIEAGGNPLPEDRQTVYDIGRAETSTYQEPKEKAIKQQAPGADGDFGKFEFGPPSEAQRAKPTER